LQGRRRFGEVIQ